MTFSASSTAMTRSSSAYICNGLEARGRLEIRTPQEKKPKQYYVADRRRPSLLHGQLVAHVYPVSIH
jgi:hypothetical protein